jgi:hypothetical protein
VAFLKVSRDRRGYEHFYLVQPMTRRGKTRSRVLYWFRTPPNVKVGREPFDEEARRALEARNPNVSFDWRRIVDTPIPSADAERWRERRRADRSARQEAIEEEPFETSDSPDAAAERIEGVGSAATTIEPITPSVDASPVSLAEEDGIDEAESHAEAERDAEAEGRARRESVEPRGNVASSRASAQRRRRRRRGRRGRPGATHADSKQAVEAREPDEPGDTSALRDSLEPGEPREARESEEPREPGEPSRE